ncbi:SDR family NAD(P)-dependent oxidoreductase [Paraliomyxa miuraensis]|uniref:SDR family NAD(P)-dependent oxidoreductase n=1 Tax=Paraliomyxa miuraensis TaxID=376150 RepID=UPI00224E88F2|nr:SDR family oxidoreductase [Paraliomyxa miuraensis]MCX4240472.1 SDR family oxidoreductase [Paraliomyxa miuraensis]
MNADQTQPQAQPRAPGIAIVTGASSGIGRATVERLLRQGWRVHAAARRGCDVPGAVAHAVDLTASEGVRALVDAVRPALGGGERVAVVHNAAVMESDAADRIDESTWERAMRLNVTVPALLTAALADRLGPGSAVIYIGSTLSEKAVAGRLSYCTSKHALVGLMRGTVQDFFGRGVHAVCVCPGFTDTEMLRPVLDANPGLEAALTANVAFGRLIRPEEIADLVAYCIDQPMLNGAVLHANLGQRET